jgi:hypothetical protein
MWLIRALAPLSRMWLLRGKLSQAGKKHDF